MQLRSLNGLRPLTIATGLILSTPGAMYADFDQFSHVTSVVSNQKMSQYFFDVDNNKGLAFFEMKRKFLMHLNNWENNTMFLSSAKSIIEDPDFKAIVSMGGNAVPFILERLEQEPSNLVWALNLIYQNKISNNPNTTISEACKLWIKKLRN